MGHLKIPQLDIFNRLLVSWIWAYLRSNTNFTRKNYKHIKCYCVSMWSHSHTECLRLFLVPLMFIFKSFIIFSFFANRLTKRFNPYCLKGKTCFHSNYDLHNTHRRVNNEKRENESKPGGKCNPTLPNWWFLLVCCMFPTRNYFSTITVKVASAGSPFFCFFLNFFCHLTCRNQRMEPDDILPPSKTN